MNRRFGWAWRFAGSCALATGLVLLAPHATSANADWPIVLPSSPFPVTIDGDPREALLFGALSLPGFDPVTGVSDGRFRGYLLALPEGLYAAAQDTVLKGEALRAAVSKDPGDSLLGEWVALRLRVGEEERLFVLTPGGGSATLDRTAHPIADLGSDWAGMDRRFGHTWAAEWLIPWEVVGTGPGERIQPSLVRGRKVLLGTQALEVLSTTVPGRSAGQFGGPGAAVIRPAVSSEASTGKLRALASYEVRPFVPDSATAPVCRDAVSAGEVATAWLEVPPNSESTRLLVLGTPAPVEFFRVDFWWQAGPREEQAALFPARAAAGEGDCLMAERLFPIRGGVLPPGVLPTRIYARMRVPRSVTPGEMTLTIRAQTGKTTEQDIEWKLQVAPPLPASDALCGVFYLGVDPAQWAADLQNMADHGINAATCYAEDAKDQKLFAQMAERVGINGRFPMVSIPPPAASSADKSVRATEAGGPVGRVPSAAASSADKGVRARGGIWAYAYDEPASAEAVRQAGTRAQDLRSRAFRPWAALCWTRSLELLPLLDGVALSPSMVVEAANLPGDATRWVYFMGGREEPGYIRRCAAGLSRFPGLSGFWVWCYANRPSDWGDWTHPYYRDIACRAPDGEGGLLDTVQWEALRDGILDRRLAEAIRAQGGDPAVVAPALEPSRRGLYWLPEGPFPHGEEREALTRTWALGST